MAPASAAEEVPITPEIVAAAEARAAADPMSEEEMAAAATQAEQLYATDPQLTADESAAIEAGLKSGELSAWVNGKKLEAAPMKARAAQPDAVGINAVYVPVTWGACGVSSASNKHVRMFYLSTVPYAGKNIPLQCGTSGWGYRHIQERHMNDWANKAVYVGANWRDMADFAITDALQHVYSGTYNASNNTYLYRGVVELRRYNGSTVHTFYPHVVVAAGDNRMITAFPSSTR